MSYLELQGKTALVCGASKGIGAATAQAFARAGARVILMARDMAGLESVRHTMERPQDHQCVTQDLGDLDGLRDNLKVLLKSGTVSILVCNSGGPKGGPLLEATEGEFVKAFTQHLLANQVLVQTLVPGMKKLGFGRVINIISTSVKVPIPNLGVSNTIRGAVASWSKTLAGELGPFGITVNNVLPGYTATERLSSLLASAAERMGVSPEDLEEQWKQSVPARRFARPEETAAAVQFLASPAAAYINGVNLPVDGGRTGSL